MKTILILAVSCFLFTGCGLFGPSSDITPEQQNILVKKTSSIAMRIILNQIKDECKRRTMGDATVVYTDVLDKIIFAPGEPISGTRMDEYLNEILESISVSIFNYTGEAVATEDLRAAFDFLLGYILPEGRKLTDIFGLDKWQMDLCRSFLAGIGEGSAIVAESLRDKICE